MQVRNLLQSRVLSSRRETLSTCEPGSLNVGPELAVILVTNKPCGAYVVRDRSIHLQRGHMPANSWLLIIQSQSSIAFR